MTSRRRVRTVKPTAQGWSPCPNRPTTPSRPTTPRPGTAQPRTPGLGRLTPGALSTAEIDLTVDLGRGLVLPNPVMVASGSLGYAVEYGDAADVDRLGGIVTRGTTVHPRIGNAAPRMTETPGGLLNAVGLQNPGVDAVIERYAPTWATWRTPVLVNVGGTSVGDYADVARRLDGVAGIAGIEVNLGCPNLGRGGLLFGLDPVSAAEVTAAVRAATDLPLVVKLSPLVVDIRPIARAVADAGADAISAINTVAGMALAADRQRPLLGAVYGGLSGPALKPIALRIVFEVVQAVKIPVIAIGGVTVLADILDFLAVGAVAVQIGTAVLADPGLPVRLVDELVTECANHGLASYRLLLGTALPARPGQPSAKGVEYRP